MMVSFKAMAGVAGIVAFGGVVAAGVAATGSADLTFTVSTVIDGDTIDVVNQGETTRVRLLNIDAPESVHPDKNVQCLGLEATDFLQRLVPPGTIVELKYDEERIDRFGRVLAGVYVGETLVNAEIARAGLGVAMVFEPNRRFYDPVRSAQAEAISAERGLYDPSLGCTLVAQANAFVEQTDQLVAQSVSAADGVEAMESYVEELAAAAAVGALLASQMADDSDSYVALVYQSLRSPKVAIEEARIALRASLADARSAVEAEKKRIEAERIEAERKEAERVEKERKEAERKAAEQKEAERKAAERKAAQQRASTSNGGSSSKAGSSSKGNTSSSNGSSSSKKNSSSSGSGSAGSDKYTGCRAYGGKYPPNAIDAKGRPYTKIDCSTKKPLP